MIQTAVPQPVTATSTTPVHLVLLWTFRVLASLQAVLFVLQPVSIGSFLQGSYPAIDLHNVVGALLVIVTVVVGTVGGLLGIVARRWFLLPASILLMVATTAQVALGATRTLSVHVPLGVLLVATALWLAGWSWTKGARR